MASVQPVIQLPPGVEDITGRVKLHQASEYAYQGAGVGGSADIFCPVLVSSGTYRPRSGATIEVAVKCIRIVNVDGKDDDYVEKAQKKLSRELQIWYTLGRGPNVIELLGVMRGVGSLPAPVCVLCAGNLLVMTDTLQGLMYMHELKPSPIVHGDIKSENILVTADEKAILCDFGRSRFPHDRPRELTGSSPFVATYRYMSPELFVPNVPGPTPASDVWAYGCVGLEPYHEVSSQYAVIELIKQGQLPSNRPRGARAALVNDSLWSTLALCWREQSWRPTSRTLLERLMQMLQNGEVSTSPVLMELFPLTIDGPLLPWPDGVRDYKDMIVIERKNGMLTSSIRTTVWMGTLSTTRRRATTETAVAIKVPRLNAAPQHREPHDHLQHMVRKILRTRFGVRHRNIVDIIGIHTGFEPHPGFVLEYCAGGSLTVFCKENYAMDLDATARLPSPDTNAYSLICDILEGLGYMHNYPVPIPQGDLTPVRLDLILHYPTQATGQDNILVSVDGTAKIGLFSVGRIIAAVPAAATLTSSVGALLPFRWMSPEILVENRNPSTESDMWAMGCVIFTGLRPYAGHLRDDFAGVDSVRGLPPGDISRIDYSKQLGERVLVPRESSWITNGIWDLTSKCWALNPLLRPSAGGFLQALKGLDGKSQNWIPPNVKDLAKKIQRVDLKENWVPMALYDTTWRQYNTRQGVKVYEVRMILVRNTYTPNWYSKPVQVIVKQVFLGWTSSQWLDPRSNNPVSPAARPVQPSSSNFTRQSVRHEIAIMAQLDHPNICKLIGVDTSFGQVPSMVFESFGDRTLDMASSTFHLEFKATKNMV
ncbi:hypothetical protein FRC12_006694 [Ceratobasidium sp. 428]|nr:hypothetical protein FRC12_006694 [Ceratobasidium sp. 428]